MKWRVGHPESTTSKAASSDKVTGRSVIVDVPDALRQGLPRLGEPFAVGLLPATDAKPSPEAATVSCCFLADGKSLLVDGRVIRLTRQPLALKHSSFRLRAAVDGPARDHVRTIERVRPVQPKHAAAASAGGDVTAPMTGKVIKVAVTEGQPVAEGDILVVIEAMKMENQIRAEGEGVVGKIKISEGTAIKIGELMLTIAAPTANGANT